MEYAEQMLCDERRRALFRRMVSKSDVDHRFSPLQLTKPTKADEAYAHDVYIPGSFPSTAQRMKLFERFAPTLVANALDRLGLAEEEHVVCVGDVCAARADAEGAAGTTRLRDLVRARNYSGDDAISCHLKGGTIRDVRICQN